MLEAASSEANRTVATPLRGQAQARRELVEAPPAATPAADEPSVVPDLIYLTEAPAVGAAVFVPRECWPAYTCREHAGQGWSATVVSRTRFTVVVSFDHATTARGVRYHDERLDWAVLKGFA